MTSTMLCLVCLLPVIFSRRTHSSTRESPSTSTDPKTAFRTLLYGIGGASGNRLWVPAPDRGFAIPRTDARKIKLQIQEQEDIPDLSQREVSESADMSQRDVSEAGLADMSQREVSEAGLADMNQREVSEAGLADMSQREVSESGEMSQESVDDMLKKMTFDERLEYLSKQPIGTQQPEEEEDDFFGMSGMSQENSEETSWTSPKFFQLCLQDLSEMNWPSRRQVIETTVYSQVAFILIALSTFVWDIVVETLLRVLLQKRELASTWSEVWERKFPNKGNDSSSKS